MVTNVIARFKLAPLKLFTCPLETKYLIFKKKFGNLININVPLRPLNRGVEQLVARRAHNPKVVGSSPASATTKSP
jgi:hypothetical protein